MRRLVRGCLLGQSVSWRKVPMLKQMSSHLLDQHPAHPDMCIPVQTGWRLAVSSLCACRLEDQVPMYLQKMSLGILADSPVSLL